MLDLVVGVHVDAPKTILGHDNANDRSPRPSSAPE
ncbi:MAG: hypothetical protein ACI89X_002337 [Planctomycetota bacterium]|jgi:hypothetical protein